MVIKADMVNLDGKMAPIIKAVMLKVKDTAMGSFLILKIKQKVEGFGKMAP